jgi:hypothetical protein
VSRSAGVIWPIYSPGSCLPFSKPNNNNTVSVCSVNLSTGLFSACSESDVALTPISVTLSPSNSQIYVSTASTEELQIQFIYA